MKGRAIQVIRGEEEGRELHSLPALMAVSSCSISA